MLKFAIGFVAGRYFTSEGQLNLAKDTGKIPDYITQSTMNDASEALLNTDGFRPSLKDFTTEQRGRFLTGAAVVGRNVASQTPQQTREALQALFDDLNIDPNPSNNTKIRTEINSKKITEKKINPKNIQSELEKRYGRLEYNNPLESFSVRQEAEKDDDSSKLNVGSRIVLQYTTAKDAIEGATSYVHVPLTSDDAPPKNLVINRLVHEFDPVLKPGHDVIHLATGFGLNGKGANRIGAPFPLSQLDLPVDTKSGKQRNVNGILIENTTDGIYEALKENDVHERLKNSVSNAHRNQINRLIFDLENRTGRPRGILVAQDGIQTKSDFERQAYELAGAGLGDLFPDWSGTRLAYAPLPDNIDVHTKNFRQLFKDKPEVREEIIQNMIKYSRFVMPIAKTIDNELAPSDERIEMSVSPETTRALIETAIRGYEELRTKYPSSPALPELINYYRSILQRGEDGTPAIVQAPGGDLAQTG